MNRIHFPRSVEHWVALGVLGVVVATASNLHSQTPNKEPIELRWKFAQGQAFYQEISSDSVQHFAVMDTKVDQNQKQTFWIKWTPKKGDDRTWMIEQEIIGVTMDISIGGNHVRYDSRGPNKSDPLADFFAALVGARFTFTINKADLKVEKIAGREKFVEKLGKANEQLKPLLQSILAEDAFKQMIDPFYSFLPPDGLIPKDKKWTRKTGLSMGPVGTFATVFDCTYEGVNEEKLEKIRVEAPLQLLRPNVKVKEARVTGIVLFDRAKGRLHRSEVAVKLDWTSTFTIQGNETEIHLRQTQNTIVLISDKNPLQK